MSLLETVHKGPIQKPHLILIYGPDKVGKTTFAASAPNPIFLGTEDGSSHLDVARFPSPQTYDDCLAAIAAIESEKHEYKTLVIDSLDWMEPLVYNKLCREGNKATIEDFGYGSGYKKALVEWRKMIAAIERVQKLKGMNVIMIAHAHVKTFNDPQTQAPYDRYQLKLYEGTSAIFREFSECIFFANFEISMMKREDERKGKAFGEGDRKIYTERRPAFDAGNRIDLPFELDLSWKAYVDAFDKKKALRHETIESMTKSIQGLIENVKDAELVIKVKDRLDKAVANRDRDLLGRIKGRLTELVTAQ